MKRSPAAELLRAIFTQDLGRKAMGLLCSVLLFAILDSQIQTESGEIPVRVVVATRDELAGYRGNRNHEFILVLLERLEDRRPVVITAKDRDLNHSTSVDLRGPKTAIEKLKSVGAVFTYAVREGRNVVDRSAIDGMETVEAALGPSFKDDWKDLPNFDAVFEVEQEVEFLPEDLVLTGQPAFGRYFKLEDSGLTLVPPRSVLIGPKNLLDDALRLRPLFAPVSVQGVEENPWSTPLKIAPRLERDGVRFVDPITVPTARLTFSLQLVEPKKEEENPPARFRRQISVEYDRDLLAENPWYKEGRRLTFEGAEASATRMVELLIEVPEPEAASITNQELKLARREVALVVRAHEADHPDGNSLEIRVLTFQGFPKTWTVRVAKPAEREVRMRWTVADQAATETEHNGND